jgi:catechol 2,3-dioxygenase-like lactoylglutathione lyase family enzyme
MAQAQLEHVNLTVTDPALTAALLQRLCGWTIRWEGPSMGGGHTIHIGSKSAYVALYTSPSAGNKHGKGRPFNHIGLLVDDLAAAEEVVTSAGLKAWGHDDYEPGRRFYFYDHDGIEFEVVSYE